MAKHRGQGEPDDAVIGALLRDEGDRYAPDAARIRARIDAGLARGVEQPVTPRLRYLPPLAGAIAVAATLVGVVVLVERNPDVPAPNATTTAIAAGPSGTAGSVLANTGQTLSAQPVPSSASSAARTSARPSSSNSSGTRPTTITQSPSGTSQQPPPGETRAVATAVASLPAQLSLPVSGGEIRDWVVVGARNDGKLIRQKGGVGLIGAPEAVSGPAEPADAPIDVLWGGGVPEQNRTVNGKWWTAPSGPTAFRVRLGSVDRPGRVTFYLGAEGTTVQVRASVDGLSGTGSSASVSPGARAAVTIELDQAAVGHTVTIEIGAGNSTTDGTISLAAVVLR